jgi:hypothetical protein
MSKKGRKRNLGRNRLRSALNKENLVRKLQNVDLNQVEKSLRVGLKVSEFLSKVGNGQSPLLVAARMLNEYVAENPPQSPPRNQLGNQLGNQPKSPPLRVKVRVKSELPNDLGTILDENGNVLKK